MGRDDDTEARTQARIAAILERGRRTRKPQPRALWIAAAIVGAICAGGFAVAMLGTAAPERAAIGRPAPEGAGFGTGLVVGVTAGLAIGVALPRQRRDHSSHSSP
jgi:formate/nitrite transporter FocA (FNT family)